MLYKFGNNLNDLYLWINAETDKIFHRLSTGSEWLSTTNQPCQNGIVSLKKELLPFGKIFLDYWY